MDGLVRVWLGSPLLSAPPAPMAENPSPHKLTPDPVHDPSRVQPPEALAWLPSFLQRLSYLCVGRRSFQSQGLCVLEEGLRFATPRRSEIG